MRLTQDRTAFTPTFTEDPSSARVPHDLFVLSLEIAETFGSFEDWANSFFSFQGIAWTTKAAFVRLDGFAGASHFSQFSGFGPSPLFGTSATRIFDPFNFPSTPRDDFLDFVAQHTADMDMETNEVVWLPNTPADPLALDYAGSHSDMDDLFF